MKMHYMQRSVQPVIRSNGYEFPRGAVEAQPVLKYVALNWLKAQKNKKGVIAAQKHGRKIAAMFKGQAAKISRLILDDE